MPILDRFAIGLGSKFSAFVLKDHFRALPFRKKPREAAHGGVVLTFFVLFFTTSPATSSLVINPVSLEFSPKVTVQEITMENQANETKAFEISLKSWQQDKGQDIYADTNDIIVFPLATKLTPHSKQKFRLILKNLSQGTQQVAYRLFFSERPFQRMSKAETAAVTFLLNMTVPVFFVGAQFIPVEKIDWSYDVVKNSNSIILSVNNNGSKFIKIRNIVVKEVPSFKSGDWQYVLPATSRSWTMPLMKKTLPNSLTINYAAAESFEEIKKSATVSLSSVNIAGKTSDQKMQNTKIATTKP